MYQTYMATSQIISNRLTKWSQKQEKILKNQFGFQKSKSTVDCIFVPHSIITKNALVKGYYANKNLVVTPTSGKRK